MQNTEPLIPGWMAKEDLIVIATLAATLGLEDSIVEVGSWMGQSTDCWAAHTQATVYAIDLWEWMPKEYEGSAKSRVNLKGDPFSQFSRFVERHDNIVPLKRNSSGVPWEHEAPAVVSSTRCTRTPGCPTTSRSGRKSSARAESSAVTTTRTCSPRFRVPRSGAPSASRPISCFLATSSGWFGSRRDGSS